LVRHITGSILLNDIIVNNLSNKLGRLATSRVKEKVSKAKTDYYVEKRKEIEHTKGKIQKSVYSHGFFHS
jgi:hypothetical protein